MKEKTCTKCGETKSIEEFYLNNRKARKGRKKRRERSAQCKTCESKRGCDWAEENKARHSANGREWRRGNPERSGEISKRWCESNRFARALHSTYYYAEKHGYAPCLATVREVETAFTGKCFACGLSEGENGKRLCLDHSHQDGRFRGFLCGNCNTALGLLGDSEVGITQLLAYVQEDK